MSCLLARHAGLLFALSLLTWSATAYAECAWVLWDKHVRVNFTPGQPIEEREWQVVAAVTSYGQCYAAAKEQAKRDAEISPKATNVKTKKIAELIGGGFLVTTELKTPEKSSLSVESRCLPDTVDPRGGKGK